MRLRVERLRLTVHRPKISGTSEARIKLDSSMRRRIASMAQSL
jgi:hypothetical protein